MELTPDIIGNRLSRLDVLAKTGDGTEINIEVQLKAHKNMGKRSLFYWGRTFGNALKSGKDSDYIDLPNIITINILNFEYLDGEPECEFHNTYHVRNDRSGKILDGCLEMHFLEMPKFLRLKDKDIATNKIHRWLAFFDSNISEETLKELIEMDAGIQQAQKKIEYISNDADTYRQILLREMEVLDYNSDMSAAKREGIEEGEEKGKLEGKLEGRLEGRLEEQKKIIEKMLKRGDSAAEIADFLEITVEAVETAKNELAL
jgi:predicted transposase/invertase (TIGR01784 family)